MKVQRGWRIHWARTTFSGNVVESHILMMTEEGSKSSAIQRFWTGFHDYPGNTKSIAVVRVERVMKEEQE